MKLFLIVPLTGLAILFTVMFLSGVQGLWFLPSDAAVPQKIEQVQEPALPNRFLLICKERLEENSDEWIFIYRDTFSDLEFVKYKETLLPLGKVKPVTIVETVSPLSE